MFREFASYWNTVFGDSLPPQIVELEQSLFSSLICIDHGYDPTRPGYTAAGFVDKYGRIITAAHNIRRDGYATIIHPFLHKRRDYGFGTFEPDTAVSIEPYEGMSSRLDIGVPQVGDVQLAFWLRHIGQGEFIPCSMWGVNIGAIEQDGKIFWGFLREGEHPRRGDSGAVIVTVEHAGQIQEPAVVGVLRGVVRGDDICVFSPV